LLEQFVATRQRVELTVLEGHSGALGRDLKDGRIDALLSPFGTECLGHGNLRALELGVEPWVVLVGANHPLAGSGPLRAAELEGQEIAINGHRDGSSYDRAVAQVLDELGVSATFSRIAPGPALQHAVARGEALVLTTAPEELHPGVSARSLHPMRMLGLQLVWRKETASPALAEFVRLAATRGGSIAASRPALAAVA
jgi:DNA-binding transcriptional LysR family regulator